MNARKINITETLESSSDDQNQNRKDKMLIEALRKRLDEMMKDPKNAKKAAMILEWWIQKKSK
jgi:hypothetical protein